MCVHARIPLSRSASTFGKLVARLSSNFYSLSGTDDKKTAQTESPRSFLSRYTCSFSSPSLHLLNFLVHHPLTLSSFVPSVSSTPSLFPFFHSTNDLFSLGPGSPKACFNSSSSSRFHDAPLVDLLPSHRRVPRKSSWLGPPLDKISLIRSRPSKVFLPPPCLESLLLETLCFLGNFLITITASLFYFVSSLSLLFSSSFTLFVSASFFSFGGLLFSLCGCCGFALSCILFLNLRVVLQSSTLLLDNLLLLVVFRLGRSFFVTGIAASVSWMEENLILRG